MRADDSRTEHFFSLFALLLGAFLSACYADAIFECDHEERSLVESGDGRFKASVVLVQCGATTSDATWVLLYPAKEKPDPDSDKVAVFEGTDLRVEWVDRQLKIAYGDVRLFKNESSLHGIQVQYMKIDSER